MKILKTPESKKTGKQEREKRVLIGLIEHYLKTGKPVGSNTLKEAGFENLSSATIRNYFAHMEEQGLLAQSHASGGRAPTEKALHFYAQEFIDSKEVGKKELELLEPLRKSETREIASFLQNAAEILSSLTYTSVFLSAPRFDHDFIIDLKVLSIDAYRLLCVVITDFGVIRTELLHTEKKLSAFGVKRIEGYFHFRLTGHDRPENLEKEEEMMAQELYNELMVRYIVGYSNFIDEEIYRTGFSKLLLYPDFADAPTLAESLALFENARSMRLLLRESLAKDKLKYWIGEDLKKHTSSNPECAVLAIPYRIHGQVVGAIGILGPKRMPYKRLFGLLRVFSEVVSEALTRNIYKFKLQYRQPQDKTCFLTKEESLALKGTRLALLEDKTGSNKKQ